MNHSPFTLYLCNFVVALTIYTRYRQIHHVTEHHEALNKQESNVHWVHIGLWDIDRC
jgi:hypothetical protein